MLPCQRRDAASEVASENVPVRPASGFLARPYRVPRSGEHLGHGSQNLIDDVAENVRRLNLGSHARTGQGRALHRCFLDRKGESRSASLREVHGFQQLVVLRLASKRHLLSRVHTYRGPSARCHTTACSISAGPGPSGPDIGSQLPTRRGPRRRLLGPARLPAPAERAALGWAPGSAAPSPRSWVFPPRLAHGYFLLTSD